MKGLKCENVVLLRSVLRSSRHIWLVLECMSGGSLLDILMSSGRMDEQQSRWYFRQILAGVACMHARGIYHRDLKPDNVLLTSDMLNVKIADFGLATLVDGDRAEHGKHSSRVGSTQYAAPELFDVEEREIDLAPCDIWGCGLLLYIMAAGFPPFSDVDADALIVKIRAARVKFPSWFSEDLKDLLRKILKRDPKERLSIEDIRKHAWIKTTAATSKPLSSPTLRLNSPSSIPKGFLSLHLSGSPPNSSASSSPRDSATSSSDHFPLSSIPFALHQSAPQLHLHVPLSNSGPSSTDQSTKLGSSGSSNGSATAAERTPPSSPYSTRSASSSSPLSPMKIPSIIATDADDNPLAHSGIHNLSDSVSDMSSIIPPDVVPIANAFTLLNMSGAFDLSRLFHGPALKPFTLIHATKFVWQRKSVTQAFYDLVDILESLTLSIKKYEQAGRITAKAWRESMGSCTFQIQLYTLLPDASLVEFSILGGSEKAYYEFYRTISERTKAVGSQHANHADFEDATLDDSQDKLN